MKVFIISFPILFYVLVRWFVYKLIKKKYPVKKKRREFIKSNQINNKLADLLKPLSGISLILLTLFFEKDDELEGFTLILNNVLIFSRVALFLVCTIYSYYVFLELKDCLKMQKTGNGKQSNF